MQCPSCSAAVEGSPRFCPNCGSMLAAASEPRVQDPLIGHVLGGKYTVVKLLGEGGMGAVYEGEQQLGTTKRKVAVKTLHPHLSRDPSIQARFEREVGTIAELSHPNTIQVYDFGATADGILYLVMEFLHGRSLADLIASEGSLSPERATTILEQICGSLEEAHGRGIVHRDLKPDNVLLVERAGKKDFVKVLDFGIAKRASEEDRAEQKLTQQGMVLGTPPYMSPEQFTGTPVDRRSDIYALGIMAYEMLSGKLPFKADTAWEWATQHMSQPPIPIESLPEGARVNEAMRAALRRALAKSPDARFQTVQEFCAAFSGAAPIAAVTAPLVASAPRTELATAVSPPAAPLASRGTVTASSPGFTPAGGNVTFPTPASIPQAPLSDPAVGGGSSRRTLLVAAGVIGVASACAIAYALRGRAGPKEVDLDEAVAAPAPATSLSAGSAAGLDPSPVDVASGDVPPLSSPKHAVQVRPVSSPGASAPHSAPSATSPPALPAPKVEEPKYDGPECARARMLRSIGRHREAQRWTLACLAKGGDPN